MNITQALLTDVYLSGDMAATPSGDLATVAGLANYKLALFHRLITIPGTLVHRPTYGVGVTRYQNGLASFAKQQELAAIIVDQFGQDARTQKISSVLINNSDVNPSLTIIQVFVVPKGYTEMAVSFTPFNP